MREAEAWRGDELLGGGAALNDCIVGRSALPRLTWLETYIDGAWTTTYYADCLIVATPTGSTAYALSAGGPILPPQLRNFVLMPVAPHLSLDRAIVLAADAEVKIQLRSENKATLTIDGQENKPLRLNDVVLIRASRHVSRFVRLGDRRYFYRALLDRFEPKRVPNHPANDAD